MLFVGVTVAILALAFTNALFFTMGHKMGKEAGATAVFASMFSGMLNPAAAPAEVKKPIPFHVVKPDDKPEGK